MKCVEMKIQTLVQFVCVFFGLILASSQSMAQAGPANPLTFWRDLVGIMGVVTIAIAVATFWFNFRKYRKEQADAEAQKIKASNDKEIREWQKVVILSIAQKSASPLTFEQIRTSYIQEATVYQGTDIPKKEVSDQALRRVILEMLESDILRCVSEARFILNTLDYDMQKASSIQARQVVFGEELRPLMYGELRRSPGVFTPETFANILAQKTNTEPALVRIVIHHFQGMGIVGLNEDGKLLWALDG